MVPADAPRRRKLTFSCDEPLDMHYRKPGYEKEEGQYKLGPGTLYDNLQMMIERRLVEEVGQKEGDDDPRRRYYRLSSLGRGVLAAETARLASVVREARLRLQLVKPRRA